MFFHPTSLNGIVLHPFLPARTRGPLSSGFRSVCVKAAKSGTVHRRVDGQGRGHIVPTPEAEEAVLQYVENNLSVSTLDIARHFHMSHVTVWRILQEMLLRLYHLES